MTEIRGTKNWQLKLVNNKLRKFILLYTYRWNEKSRQTICILYVRTSIEKAGI